MEKTSIKKIEKETVIDNYIIERELLRTNHSVLYEARDKKGELGGVFFIIKVYCDGSPKTDAVKELSISQFLEKNSKISVSIPVLKRFQFEGNECLVMQEKRHGVFLKEIFGDRERERAGALERSGALGSRGGDAAGAGALGLRGVAAGEDAAGGSYKAELRLEEILTITEKILYSLSVLHEFKYRGKRDRILHLDLHPGNILIENYESITNGEVKFIDFSNAYEEQFKDRHSEISPMPSGYSAFSAPELVENETEEICEGTDLYSVASIMFWMMTGRAYESEMSLFDEIDAFGEREGLPSIVRNAVVQFLHCGLENNTFYRFKSASEMIDALSRISKLFNSVQDSRYTEALSLAYEMMVSLKEARRIPMGLKEHGFAMAIGELEKNIKVYQIDVPRRQYEFEYYWEMIRRKRGGRAGAGGRDEIKSDLMMRVIRCGLAICNYTGDGGLKDELRREYEKFKDNMPIMEYLGLSTVLAEQDVDKCRYTEALERNKNSIRCMEIIRDTFKRCADLCDIKGREAYEYKDYARANSAAGRCVSFLWAEHEQMMRVAGAESSGVELVAESSGVESSAGAESSGAESSGVELSPESSEVVCSGAESSGVELKREAIRYFDRAIEEFGEDRFNRHITLSHLLHHVIDIRDKELFVKYAREYLEDQAPWEWLDAYVKEEKNDLYKLHLCLRGLYWLYRDEVSKDVAGNLSELLVRLVRAKNYSHPAELIYKYIGLLLFEYSHKVTREVKWAFRCALNKFDVSCSERDRPLDIFEVMGYQTLAIYYSLCGDEDAIDAAREALIGRCQDGGWDELLAKIEAGKPMTGLLTYEYS